ncbi:MAG: lysozyme [Rhizobiaceae bacterium]|nr:lysozyme [Rhizobiaceae bacterium]
MKISQQGLELLKAREGCRLKPYRDSVGVWTDGWGNTHGVIPNGPPITQEKADADLVRHLEDFERAVNQSVKVDLEQHQFDALVSFAYNVGVGAFQSSTMLKLINAGDFDGAAHQFNRWRIPPEITSRRHAERKQFEGEAFEARIAA